MFRLSMDSLHLGFFSKLHANQIDCHTQQYCQGCIFMMKFRFHEHKTIFTRTPARGVYVFFSQIIGSQHSLISYPAWRLALFSFPNCFIFIPSRISLLQQLFSWVMIYIHIFKIYFVSCVVMVICHYIIFRCRF